jgi:hypothetical protein
MAFFLEQLSSMRNGSGRRGNQGAGLAHGGKLFMIGPGKACGSDVARTAKYLKTCARKLGTTLALLLS